MKAEEEDEDEEEEDDGADSAEEANLRRGIEVTSPATSKLNTLRTISNTAYFVNEETQCFDTETARQKPCKTNTNRHMRKGTVPLLPCKSKELLSSYLSPNSDEAETPAGHQRKITQRDPLTSQKGNFI